ncbi:MAG: phosphotransferase enzyme family protein [Chloroflexota bacterium]
MFLADLRPVINQFQWAGDAIACVQYGTGHIHRTYRLSCREGDRLQDYILQKINHRVFTAPEQLIDNMLAVTAHLRQKSCARGDDPLRRVVTLIPTWQGEYLYRTPQGDYWRAQVFIEGASASLQAQSPWQIYQAAHAFGAFQDALGDFPPSRLHVTIPHFHHTPRRFEDFLGALRRNTCARAQSARAEIAFALQRAGEVGRLAALVAAGEMPERVTHNDSKLDNVLLDDETGRAICVIDLDTVMPGLAVFDFGDLVRSCCNPAREDEPDLKLVSFHLPTFALLARGFLDATRAFLTLPEIEHLAFGARLIAFEQGLRFLTDYLVGDVYYPANRPAHNLARARTQFKLVREMEAAFADMQALIKKYR